MADPSGRRPAPGAFQLLQLGAICGVCIGVGVIAGALLDGALGTGPLLAFIGLAIGIFGAAAGSIRLIRPYVTGASGGRQIPKD